MKAELPQRMMIRSGTYYCRIWVPRDVAPLFGRTIVVTSLRTKDPKTARSRLARKTVEIEEQFDLIRARKGGDDPAISAKLRARFSEIARAHAIEISDVEFAFRASVFDQASKEPERLWKGDILPLPQPVDFGHGEEDGYTYFDHLVAEGDLEAVIGYLLRFRLRQRIKALRSMRATGNLAAFISLARDHVEHLSATDSVALARLLLDEELNALTAILDGQPDPSLQSLKAEPREATISPPGDVVPAKIVTKPVSLDELFARWEAEAQPSASTLSSWRGIANNLKRFLGTKASDLNQVTPDDIVAWKDKLIQSEKSAATISRGYLSCVRALFRLAVANKLLPADPSDGIKVARKTKAGTKMLGYSNEEVAQLLKLASQQREPWKRWLPWLAAATGSRVGEVAQLHGSNVGEEEGVPVLRIAPAPDAGTIKNADSERNVPIHSALIQAGFLEFVKEKGPGPLFYARSSGDPKRKHASKGITNRLAGWIRKSGFDNPRKAPNHALRHWFKTEAARVGIADSIADAIQGHTDGRASSGYRHIGVSLMAEAIEKIELPPSTGRPVKESGRD